VVRRKGNFVRKHSTRDNVEQETQKGRTEEKRRWKGLECKTGIKSPDTRRHLRLKIERASGGFERKAFGLEFVRRVTGMSSGLQQFRNWTIWRAWPPQSEEPINSVCARIAGYVGALADQAILPPPVGKRKKNWLETNLDLLYLSSDPLGVSGLKEGAVVALGELTLREEKTSKGKQGEMKPSRGLGKEEQAMH
jgi:hypothetical protein